MTANKHTPMVVAAARALCRRASELCNVDFDDNWKFYSDDFLADAQVTLEAAAAPELLEALTEAVDLAWISDSRIVEFDPSVRFGPHYDFSGLDESALRQEFHGQYECIVWPGRKWSAYCTYEGNMWFERFDTAEEAKEQCMRLLDQALPEHPAMKARAAIAKATGGAA